MQTQKLHFFLRHSRLVVFLMLSAAAITAPRARAQVKNEGQPYARKNSFAVLAAYSPDSSHIILGVAERRKLWNFGASYSRTLAIADGIDWQYDAEFLPVTLVGDPLSRQIVHESSPKVETVNLPGSRVVSCAPIETTYTFQDLKGVVYSGDVTTFCHGRQWTIGQAILPLGVQTNFGVRRKLQPLFTTHIGYMYSTQPIPVSQAGSFNFTFDFGVGVELYRSRMRSLRIEYRFHHISNNNSAWENPGIDNGVFQIGYAFGR